MRQEDFQPNAPGQIIQSTLGYWTFLPTPLPPSLNYNTRLVSLLSEADRALGELAGAGRMLPNPHLLIRPFLRREAVLSSRIEGTITQLDELFLFEAEPDHLSHPSDAAEVRNYVIALEHGLSAVRADNPFNLQLLREVHRVLLSGVRGAEKRPGEIRDRGVRIGGATLEDARFVPPCHTALRPLLDDFVQFLREERSLPIVVQLALMHYQFETIHPFNDGNGRVGRLLITLMLCERRVLPQPLLYLSAFFEKNRQEYYDRLLDVSRRSAWEEWIEFFARGVAEQSQDAIIRTSRLLDLSQQYRKEVAGEVKTAAALLLVDELFSSPYITINRACEAINVPFKTASTIVSKLEKMGILREITGQQRYRVYRADRIFELLEQPIAP